MKSFDFPQIFQQVVGTVKFISTQPCLKTASQLKITNSPTSPKTLKFMNLSLSKRSSKNIRTMTEQTDKQKSIERQMNLRGTNRSISRKNSWQTQKRIRIEVDKDQNLRNSENINNHMYEKKNQNMMNKKIEKNTQKKAKGKVHFRISNKKIEEGNKKTKSMKTEEYDMKTEDKVKESLYQQRKEEEIRSKLRKRTEGQKMSKLTEQENSIIRNVLKKNNKKSKKNILSKQKIKLSQKSQKSKKAQKIQDLDDYGIKKMNTLQNIFCRKGSLQANGQIIYYSEKNESDEDSQNYIDKVHFQNKRISKRSNFSFVKRGKLGKTSKNRYEQNEVSEQNLSRKNIFKMKKKCKLTSIQNIISEDEQINAKKFKKTKQYKSITRIKNKQVADNIYTELNYFNLQLHDKPKEEHDQFDNVNLPVVIPLSLEYKNQQSELQRKERFQKEGQMINLGIRMGKGHILKQKAMS